MNSCTIPDAATLRATLAHLYESPAALESAIHALLNTSSVPVVDAIDGVDLDLQRRERCGFPEVVFGEGKTVAMIVSILQKQREVGQDSLVTRVRSDQAGELLRAFPDAIYNETARTLRRHVTFDAAIGSESSINDIRVFVVAAGSSDRAVAEEALETLHWMRVRSELIIDVGVAGPHRLQRHVARLQKAVAIVCVAGMEAALPSVVGGYVPCPVIGVPTSVGYGASLQGITAMLSMLTCCASNVSCVNIDAGFKGGYVAGLIASRVARQ
ncbi:MAG: nickel pincer cofactor biosynthesis protein LarB [Planctomycetales bacterium]|jgi:NCAIR mutase (PurE)-related protein|nr:nickel pincer cofactor biosynthesis protein LarB [Planctomycetales bacterium]